MRGGSGIYEIMLVDEALRRLILQGASADEIDAAARKAGMIPLKEDGHAKAPRASPRSKRSCLQSSDRAGKHFSMSACWLAGGVGYRIGLNVTAIGLCGHAEALAHSSFPRKRESRKTAGDTRAMAAYVANSALLRTW